MRLLGIALAVIVAGAAAMLYVSRIYVRPWRSRRATARLLRENDELDRQLEALRSKRKDA